MFEKHFGRKISPKVTAEHDPSFAPKEKPLFKESAEKSDLKEWFSGSVVANADGTPVPVFHGTRGLLSFEDVYRRGAREMGMHFGTAAAANARFEDTFDSSNTAESPEKTYAWARERILKSEMSAAWMQQQLEELEQEEAQAVAQYNEQMSQKILGDEKMYPVYLRITNPVRVNDIGSFSNETLKSIKKDLVRNFVPRDQVERIEAVNTIDELRTTLIELGYDGVVYKNSVEGEVGDSYIPIVGPEQIRSVFD